MFSLWILQRFLCTWTGSTQLLTSAFPTSPLCLKVHIELSIRRHCRRQGIEIPSPTTVHTVGNTDTGNFRKISGWTTVLMGDDQCRTSCKDFAFSFVFVSFCARFFSSYYFVDVSRLDTFHCFSFLVHAVSKESLFAPNLGALSVSQLRHIHSRTGAAVAVTTLSQALSKRKIADKRTGKGPFALWFLVILEANNDSFDCSSAAPRGLGWCQPTKR